MRNLKLCLAVLSAMSLFSSLSAYEKIPWNSKALLAGKASLTSESYIIKRALGKANFSPEFAMPVELVYDSSETKRGLFGDVWRSPQLESRVFPRDEKTMEWLTPWGEKIPFFEKQRVTKDTLDIYKEQMKGRGFFSPYADWEAKGSKGNWTIEGQNKKEGWKFEYKKSYLKSISAPSGRKITFDYSKKKLIAVKQDGQAFIEISCNEKGFANKVTVNGVSVKLAYSKINGVVMPENTVQGKVSIERGMLSEIIRPKLDPEKLSYDNYGYLSGIVMGKFRDEISVEHETEGERLAFLKKIEETKKAGKSTVNILPEKVTGRILKDRFFNYSYPVKETISLQNAKGQLAVYNYSDLKGVLKIKGFNGLEKQIFYFRRYDVAYNGKLRQIRDAKDRVVVNCRYDKKTGELIRSRDMADNETYYKYDKNRNLILVSRTEDNPDNPIRPLASFKYDSKGNPVEAAKLDSEGKAVWVTKFRYSPAGEVTDIETPESRFKIEYNDFGYVKKITDSFGRAVSMAYGPFNRLFSRTSPDGVKTVYSFEDGSNLLESVSSFVPDMKDAVSSLSIKYNSMGLPDILTDHKGRTKKFQRDELGRVLSEIFPDDSAVGYVYSKLGQLTRVNDQNGNPIEFEYNNFGKIARKLTPAGQETEYEYDEFGMLKNQRSGFAETYSTDRNISYVYDDFDRVSSIDYGNGKTKTFAYDSYGKILSTIATDEEDGKKIMRKSEFAYDQFDRVSKKTVSKYSDSKSNSVGLALEKLVYEYAYTPSGKRSSVTVSFPDGSKKITKNSYDRYGRLVETVDGDRKVTYKYDKNSKLSEQTINGVPVKYSYSKLGQLESKIMGDAKNPIASLKYIYDVDGTLTGREVNGKLEKYEYDLKGQLLAVRDSEGKLLESYTYDSAGNILKKIVDGKATSCTYDKANQLISAFLSDGSMTEYVYDGAGRLISEKGKSGSKTYAYGWLDKVTEVVNNGVKSNFTYHPDGQLESKTSADKSENFFWDGLALIKRDSTDYLNEPAVTGGNPILADDKVMFNDMLGNTLGVKDGENFDPITRDAFGALEPSEAGATDKPLEALQFFTGKPYVEELGAVFLFRNYRSDLGKWQTADPLGYPDGWNNFAYCNNGATYSYDWLGGITFSAGAYIKRSTSLPDYVGIDTPGQEEYDAYAFAVLSINTLLIGLPTAKSMALHYLDNSGSDYTVGTSSIEGIFSSMESGFQSDATSYIKGLNLSSGTTTDFVSGLFSKTVTSPIDLYLSLHVLDYCVSGKARKNSDGSIDVILTVNIYDYYDFSTADDLAGIGLQDVDWLRLAQVGLAKPYNVYGSYKFSFTIPE